MPKNGPILPRYNVLYFKNIIDRCFSRFFVEYSDSFAKTTSECGDRYVFSSGMSQSALTAVFSSYFDEELSRFVSKYSEVKPEYFLIIGSCIPIDNFALDFVNGSSKLRKLVETAPDIRYFLKEEDISVDERLFNDVFETIFASHMGKRKQRNVFFVRSCRLDCYFTYKLLKQRYGSMVVNLHKKNSLGSDRCIYSVNERIDEFCGKKLELLKSNEIIPLREELYSYIDRLMENI